MTSPQRVRVLTPEALDAAAANLVNTANTALRAAVSQYAGTATQNGTSGVSTATPNTIIQRDVNARAQVATPSASSDIATKGYVDTTVGGYIPTSQKGAASGIASLDSNGLVTVAQLPTFLNRYLGSGTSFPTGARAGDKFTHTGIGCVFQYDGTSWWQNTPCVVASRAARDMLITNYASAIHPNFSCLQSDKGYNWRRTYGAWTFDGWVGPSSGGDVTGATGSVDSSPSVKYTALNFSVNNATTLSVNNWTLQTIDSTHGLAREFITLGSDGKTFTFNDRLHVSVNAHMDSDTGGAPGGASLYMNVPGGSSVFPTGAMANIDHRGQGGYTGNGFMNQPVTWVGYANPGATMTFSASQANTNGSPLNLNFYMSIEIFPG